MPLHVDFLVLFASKGAITNLTDKRFLPSVTSVMRGQRILFLEGHWAPVTLVRIILDVPIVMIFQLHLITECLIAVRDGTSKRPLGMMDGLDVFIQAAFFSKLFAAIRTYFRNNIAMQSQVSGVALLL